MILIITLTAPCFWYVFVLLCKRNHHEYLRLNREWHNLNLMKSGAKALSATPPARCLPCTLYWTYVGLSLCDRCHWRIHFSVEEFNFPSSFKTLYSCLYFMVSVSLTLIIWFKNLAFSERNSKDGDNLTNSWSWRCLKVYINSSILLHTTPVYWVWVSVYTCLYKSQKHQMLCRWCLQARSK